MAVSEAQQLFASSLAYVDLDKAFEELSQNTPGPVTLKAALQYAQENGVKMGDFSRFLENGNLKKEYKYAEDWVITAVVNQNTTNVVDPTGAPANTGLYACIFDTGNANILACRGSEDMKEYINYHQDWYEADLKLLNSTMTNQELALEDFMKKHENLLTNKPWVSTGHSLGGALADYAAIMSAKYGFDNYEGTINFDGPGHSQEFIELYKDEIAQVSGKMVHKKASIVGHLLNDLPGVKQEYIATKDVELFDRHSIENWDLDENSETKPGEPRWYETALGGLSRYIDWLPAPIGNLLIWGINLGAEAIFWLADFKNDHPLIFKMLLTGLLTYVLRHPLVIGLGLNMITHLIGYVFLLLGAVTLGKLLFEGMEWLLRETLEAVCAAVSWLKDKAVELYNVTMEFIRSIPQYLHSLTPGAKYASSNPYFRADPELLRDYARRLAAVNARLMSLDRDLDQLYLQVGLMDVGDILLTNIITSYSARLGLARNYLNSAADTLENADNQALRYMGG